MSHWEGYKGFWAYCDQGIISAGNFLTNLILIRHLPPSEFGVFALMVNAFLFLNNLHASTVTYTVCIKGAQAGGRTLSKVATGGIFGTLGFSVLNVIALCFATRYVGHPGVLAFAVLASTCWQGQEALRTVFLSRLRFDRAIPGDALSYLGQAVLVGCLSIYGTLTLPRVFQIMMGTSLLGGLLQVVQIRPTAVTWSWLRSFGTAIWTLGRWSVLAKLVAFFSLQVFPWVLAYRYGFATVATFQALFQLVSLTNPILLGSNNLIMASVARSRQQRDPFVPLAMRYMFYSGAIVGAYFVVLLVGGGRVMSLFYGRHSPYLLEAPLLRVFVAAYALEFLSMLAGAILAGMEKTRELFIQQLCGMMLAVCLILPFVIRLGLRAAITGLLAVNAAKALSGWYMVYVARPKGPRITNTNVAATV